MNQLVCSSLELSFSLDGEVIESVSYLVAIPFTKSSENINYEIVV
jgi:hypothetical protein